MLLRRGGYPAPERLAAQFAASTVTRICDCGCNSFDIEIRHVDNLRPLALPRKQGGMIFETDLALDDGRQLELLVFCDKDGNLAGVDIQCNGNSEPVPETPMFDAQSFHVSYSSPHILAD